MALKPDRRHNEYDIDVTRFMDSIADGGERGGVVVRATGTSPSGAAMDQTVNAVHYAADPSGRTAAGMLLADVVNLDLTKQPLNPWQSQHQVGDKVPVARAGRFVTNMIHPDSTGIVPGETAYVAESGLLSNVPADPVTNRLVFGEWDSVQDEDGYAAVLFNL